MLTELHIENIAVISKLTVSFEHGFSVLSGETGAGKSIIIDAINMVLGERTNRELIRTGESSAYVSALFRNIGAAVTDKLSEYGFENDGRNLLISRELSLDGKSTARIDGRPVTAAMLREIGKMLINIHGQNDNQYLMQPERHISFLDAYGRYEKEIEEYKNNYLTIRSVRDEIKNLRMDEEEKNRRIDLLKYQISEIDAARLKENEEELLVEKKNMIRSGAKLSEAVNTAYQNVFGDEDNALTKIGSALRLISDYVEGSQRLEKISDKLDKAREELIDGQSELADYISSLDYDENEIERIEERLDIIYRLKSKYGSSVAEILGYCENAKKELERITFSEERIGQLSKEYETLLISLKEIGNKLSQKRSDAAKKLETAVVEQLSYLNMPNVKFLVDITPCKFNANGGENVEFYISANIGEEPKPLSKVASGGELSRIMLALKSIFADIDGIATMIFDEIDTGVSGSAADRIGSKMRELSKSAQVLCITHLPQIASKADVHYLIHKDTDFEKTYTKLDKLTPEQRIREVARMISGSNITESALAAAAEMIQ